MLRNKNEENYINRIEEFPYMVFTYYFKDNENIITDIETGKGNHFDIRIDSKEFLAMHNDLQTKANQYQEMRLRIQTTKDSNNKPRSNLVIDYSNLDFKSSTMYKIHTPKIMYDLIQVSNESMLTFFLDPKNLQHFSNNYLEKAKWYNLDSSKLKILIGIEHHHSDENLIHFGIFFNSNDFVRFKLKRFTLFDDSIIDKTLTVNMYLFFNIFKKIKEGNVEIRINENFIVINSKNEDALNYTYSENNFKIHCEEISDDQKIEEILNLNKFDEFK